MVEGLALKLAETIKKADPERTASVAVMKFALEALLNTLITFIIIVLVGVITGEFIETMLGFGCFAVLRFFSGGLHLQKAAYCSLVSTVLIAVSPHIPLTTDWIYIVTSLALVILLIFAPSNIEGHARIPERFFFLLKLMSGVIVSFNFIILSSTMAVVFLVQAATTIQIKKGR